MVSRTRREFLCCSVFEWGIKKAACQSVMFFAVKSWNFVGLICLLFAERRSSFSVDHPPSSC